MDDVRALVMDAEPELRSSVAALLTQRGVETVHVATPSEALEAIRTHPFALLVGDLEALDFTQTGFLDRALRLQPALVALGLDTRGRGRPSAEAQVFDVLALPLDRERCGFTIDRALFQHRLLEDLRSLREEVQGRAGYDRLVGRSAVMERVRERIERLSQSDAPVFFLGERGTGKGRAARLLHAFSPRSAGPFLSLDCASMPEALVETELFGREEALGGGGSLKRIAGLLEGTAGGTLLLIAMPDLTPRLQERLARALEEGSAPRVGGIEPVPIGCRMLASGTRDPLSLVSEGKLRDDLCRRLASTLVTLPVLSERREDIGLLARHFIEEIRQINVLEPIHLTPEALDLLERYPWPGNVRELRSAVEHAVILAKDGIIRPGDLPDRIRSARTPAGPEDPSARSFREAKKTVVDSFEKTYLEGLLERHRGNVTLAAQQAGMLRSALQRLLRKHDLRSSAYRRERRALPSRDNA